MTRTAMEVIDGLARDGTSLAVGTVAGLFIAEQLGNAWLQEDEQRAAEDKVRQPLNFGCYLVADHSDIRGVLEDEAIEFQYRETRMKANIVDVMYINRMSMEQPCSIRLKDGSYFDNVDLLSSMKIATSAGEIVIDSTSNSRWTRLHGISLGERRLIEKEIKSRQSLIEAERRMRNKLSPPSEKRQRALGAEVCSYRYNKHRHSHLILALQAAFALFAFSFTGAIIAWMHYHP